MHIDKCWRFRILSHIDGFSRVIQLNSVQLTIRDVELDTHSLRSCCSIILANELHECFINSPGSVVLVIPIFYGLTLAKSSGTLLIKILGHCLGVVPQWIFVVIIPELLKVPHLLVLIIKFNKV